MPQQLTHTPVVRQWLQGLGTLTAVSITRQEAEIKLAAYLPMLRQDFPDAAFTVESLNHVAKACAKGFPTYPELHNALREWWKPRQPKPLRLTVDGSDEAAKHREEQQAIRASWDDPSAIMLSVGKCQGDRKLLRMLASAVRLYAPQHLGMIPPDILEALEHGEQHEPEPRTTQPKPRYLTPEELQLARGERSNDQAAR